MARFALLQDDGKLNYPEDRVKIKQTLALIFSASIVTISMAGYWTHPYPGTLPFHPFLVGYDTNGTPLYLCRAYFKGSYQPGKTWRGYDRCNIPYGGHEYQIKHDFAVYKRIEEGGHWIRGFGRIPRGALRIGTDSDNKPLFLCRAQFRHGLQPGKTWPDYNACNIAYSGREYIERDYSIFVIHGMEHHHRHHSASFAPRTSQN